MVCVDGDHRIFDHVISATHFTQLISLQCFHNLSFTTCDTFALWRIKSIN